MSRFSHPLIKNVVLPVAGFGLGWWGFTEIEQNGLLSPAAQRWLNIHNLKLQLAVQHVLPAAVTEKYGYPEEYLRSAITHLEQAPLDDNEAAQAERMTFQQVLVECEVPEQMEYLEEHASEDIPYFYIADIFNAWAIVHQSTYLREPFHPIPPKSSSTTEEAVGVKKLSGHNSKAFDSPILCQQLWDKMNHNVIPFDVGARALCVLAVSSRTNAERFNKLISVDALLDMYETYQEEETAKAKERQSSWRHKEQAAQWEVAPPAEVTVATLGLLRAMNDAAVHTRWVPLVGRPSTGPYPLAATASTDSWCRDFAMSTLGSDVTSHAPQATLAFAEVMSDKLRCSDRASTRASE